MKVVIRSQHTLKNLLSSETFTTKLKTQSYRLTWTLVEKKLLVNLYINIQTPTLYYALKTLI